MRNVELMIEKSDGTKVYLDISKDFKTSINYSINDIRDIGTKDMSYTLPIELPNTKENMTNLSYVFDITSNGNWDKSKTTKAWIFVDSVVNFEGTMLLDSIMYTPEEKYSVVLYATPRDLFFNLGDKYLSDLDWSDLNHYWNYDNIINSWTNGVGNGYCYPFINYGQNFQISGGLFTSQRGLEVNNFYPAIYLKTLVDKIIYQNGYSYQSDFFNTDEMYSKCIIPFCNSVIPLTIDFQTYNHTNLLFWGTNGNATFSINTVVPVSTTIGGTTYVDNYGFTVEQFNSEVYDDNNMHNTSTHDFTNVMSQAFKFKVEFDCNFVWGTDVLRPPTDPIYRETFSPNVGPVVDDIRIYVVRSKNYNGVDYPNWASPTLTDILENFDTIPFNNKRYFSFVDWKSNNSGDFVQIADSVPPLIPFTNNPNYWQFIGKVFSTDWIADYPLRTGESLRVYFVRTNMSGQYPAFSGGTIVSPVLIGKNSNIRLILDPTTVVEGSYIDFKKTLPQNIKQRDIMSSLIKMFNLSFIPVKNQYNQLLIEPEDDYLKKGVVKDYRDKLDMNKDIQSQFLFNLQKKTNLFTYKEDKDYLNTNYKNNTKMVYGEYTFTIQNPTITDTETIGPIFSPTIVTPYRTNTSYYSQYYLPEIYNYDNSVIKKIESMNIRILIFNPKYVPLSPAFLFKGVDQAIYPYSGMVDDPLNPNYSLCYGPTTQFYPDYTETNNNLFTRFWANRMAQISDQNSRLITCYLNLNPTDIANLNLNDILYLQINGENNYYYINTVEGYNPLDVESTKVTLVAAYNYNIQSVPTILQYPDQITTATVLESINPVSIGTSTPGTGGHHYDILIGTVEVPTVIVGGAGDPNTTTGGSGTGTGAHRGALVIGNGNNVNDDLNVTLGSNNTNLAENSLVIGQNNNVQQGTYSVVIGQYNMFGYASNGTNNYIFGNNNFAGSSTYSGLTQTNISNSFVIGNNNFVKSDTLTIGLNNIEITSPTASITFQYQDITYTELSDLKTNSLLVKGKYYRITDRSDFGIILLAVTENELSANGVRLMSVPYTYNVGTLPSGDYSKGIWSATFTFSVNNYCIWGGDLWVNTTGSNSPALSNVKLDNANFVRANRLDLNLYKVMSFGIKYDFDNDFICEQSDLNNNIVGISFEEYTYLSLGYNPCDITDWNANYNIYNNRCKLGICNNFTTQIYDNNCDSIYSNTTDLIFQNDVYKINNNKLQSGCYIAQNKINGGIYNNVGVANIKNNQNNGGIYGNTITGDIYNNLNNGDIFNSSGAVAIYSNINNGYISGSYVHDIHDHIDNK